MKIVYSFFLVLCLVTFIPQAQADSLSRACESIIEKLEKLNGSRVREMDIAHAVGMAKALAKHATECELASGNKSHITSLPSAKLYRLDAFCKDRPSRKITAFFDDTGFIHALKFNGQAKLVKKCVM